MSLSDAVKKYAESARARFHTPGHKGKLCSEDITEIEDEFPLDEVAAAEAKTAAYYGAKRLFYLTGGSSMGVKAMIMSAGGDILAEEKSHVSVREGAELAGVKLFTIKNEIENGLQKPVSAAAVTAALKAHPSVRAVILTSPDYYGFNASREAADAVIAAGKKLFIDGAHGAHYAFASGLLDGYVYRVADAYNMSAHKTLPAYTQTAYLAVNDATFAPIAERNLKLLGTTSPSYPMLARLEYAADYAAEHSERYAEIKEWSERFRTEFACADNDDLTRLVVDAEALGESGKSLYARLRERGITAEKYDERYVVFIFTVMDEDGDYELLMEELCAIKAGL